MLKVLRQRASGSRGNRNHRLWNAIAREAAKEREQTIQSVRRKFLRLDSLALARSAKKTTRKRSRTASVGQDDIASVVESAQRKWRTAVREARLGETPASFHAVRIKSKSFRYGLELMDAIYGETRHEHAISELKALQDKAGDWHDSMEHARRIIHILVTDATLKNDPSITHVARQLVDERAANSAEVRKMVFSLESSAAE